MQGFIFGAGLGTRLRPYTEVLAKPAIPLLGLPMVAYSLAEAQFLGLSQVTINTHHLPHTIKSALTSLKPHLQMQVEFSHETPHLLGGPGGIANAKAIHQNSPLCCLNGDSITLFKNREFLKEALAFHESGDQLFTFVTTKKQSHQNSGLWVDKNGYILAKGVETQSGCQFQHYVGVLFLKAEAHNLLKSSHKNIFDDTLATLWKDKLAKSFYIEDTLSFETGNHKDYLTSCFQLLEILLEKDHPYHQHLFNLIKLYCPQVTIRNSIIGLAGEIPNAKQLSPKGLFAGSLPKNFEISQLKGPFVLGDACDFSLVDSLSHIVLGDNAKPKGTQSYKLIL